MGNKHITPSGTPVALYFFSVGDGAIKIGVTTDIIKCLSQVQSHNPLRVRVEGYIWFASGTTALAVEKRVKRACQKYNLRGECYVRDAIPLALAAACSGYTEWLRNEWLRKRNTHDHGAA